MVGKRNEGEIKTGRRVLNYITGLSKRAEKCLLSGQCKDHPGKDPQDPLFKEETA